MSKRAKPAVAVAPEEREAMIRVAAYYVHEKSGSVPGRALEDWLTAEAQIDATLVVPASAPEGVSAAPSEATPAKPVAKAKVAKAVKAAQGAAAGAKTPKARAESAPGAKAPARRAKAAKP